MWFDFLLKKDYVNNEDIYLILIKQDLKLGFVFLYSGTTISWQSCKQTLVATSTNHSEIIELYEAAHECVWLRRMINRKSCSFDIAETPTIIYEDNVACVSQM
jgi:hypothetical protein